MVSLTRGSLGFVEPDQRTRIVPYSAEFNYGLWHRHERNDPEGIAYVDSPSHLTAQIVRSFLAGTTAWQSIGRQPSADPYLSRYGGGVLALKGSNERLLQGLGVSAIRELGSDEPGTKRVDSQPLLYGIRAGRLLQLFDDPYQQSGDDGDCKLRQRVRAAFDFQVRAGHHRRTSVGSTGLGGLTVAPGSTIYTYGGGFSGTGLTVTAAGSALPVSGSSDREITAYLLQRNKAALRSSATASTD